MGDVLAIRYLRSFDRLLLFLFLLVLAVLAVFPFYWMVIGSIMAPAELFSSVPRLWPSEPDTNSYRRIFSLVPLGRYFMNSLVVSVTTTVIAVLVSSAAGYCFARLTFFGRGILFALILGALMIPSQATIVPLFVMFANWNLLNSYPGIILPGLVSAFGVFMMTQFFRTLPPEMREAAIVDGANEFRIFLRIYLPLARPAVATLSLFVFMGTWDQLLCPVIIAFLLAQKQFIAGIAAGAVKE